jgi:AraC family transcriptional regulator
MKPKLAPDSNRLVIEATSPYDRLVFGEVHYADNYTMPLHAHEEAALVFCLQGTIHEGRQKQTFPIRPSMLTFLPAGEPHTNQFHESVKTFEIMLSSPWLERVQQVSPLMESPLLHQNGTATRLAMRLYQEFQNRDSLTALMLEGLTLELLVQIARDTADTTQSSIPRWLWQTRDFLHAHFAENLSLNIVAAAVGVHPSHLTRAFRQHFHSTLGDYVRRLRVEYACHLLSAFDKPLAQIALEAGFADQSHFSRTFKRLIGMSPARFQKVSGRADSRQEMLS